MSAQLTAEDQAAVMAAFRQDTALLNQLAPIATALSQVAELVDDTVTAVGSDAYVSALAAYQSLKLAGQGGGLDGQLDGLASRFARKTKASLTKPT